MHAERYSVELATSLSRPILVIETGRLGAGTNFSETGSFHVFDLNSSTGP